MCVPDLESPADVYSGGDKKRLLLKKGTPLNEKAKRLLAHNQVEYLEFPLPFEATDPPPFTFSQQTESALFCFARDVYIAFQNEAVEKPLEIRKQAYDLITQAAREFETIYRLEHPPDESPPQRDPRSVVHLRTVGALEDYLFEHAKNVCLTCVVLGFNYFRDLSQLLADLHKVAVAALFADIGMMKIPSCIIKKDTDLSSEDWEKIHRHPEISAQFVETIFRQKDFIATRVVLQHHERGYGTGYPAGLLLTQMEPHACLLAVVDSYCSMVSKRYFRQAQNPVAAVVKINTQAGKMLDERAVLALNYRIAPYPIGSVAHFAGDRLVHILELIEPPISFHKVRLLSGDPIEPPYNMPKTIRAFTTKPSTESPPSVPIVDHWDKICDPVDTFDLLSLYGYVHAK
jgi:HD-GYP domain-containing protein (c-di-GMP phosphodiesterase class II)